MKETGFIVDSNKAVTFTISGQKVTRDEGTPTVRDMAIALSRLTRYAGNSDATVLAHSFIVHDILAAQGCNKRLRFFGLVHDVTESVMGETPKPYKTVEYKEFENVLEARIYAERFGVRPPSDDEKKLVKWADVQSQLAECIMVGPPGLAEHCHAEERIEKGILDVFGKVLNSGFGEFGKKKGVNDFVIMVTNYLRILRPHNTANQLQLPFEESNGIQERRGCYTGS